MTRWNVGDIPEVTADEDVDHDVEIAEAEERRLQGGKKTARQLIEERRERGGHEE